MVRICDINCTKEENIMNTQSFLELFFHLIRIHSLFRFENKYEGIKSAKMNSCESFLISLIGETTVKSGEQL